MDFTKLPNEVKFAIWGHTVESRIIEIDYNEGSFITSTAPPAILHISQDSRAFGLNDLYQTIALPVPETSAINPKERYFFFNSGADTLYFRTPYRSIQYRLFWDCYEDFFALQLKRLLVERIGMDNLASNSASFCFESMWKSLYWFQKHPDDYVTLFRGRNCEIAIGYPKCLSDLLCTGPVETVGTPSQYYYLLRKHKESFHTVKSMLNDILDSNYQVWPRRMKEDVSQNLSGRVEQMKGKEG